MNKLILAVAIVGLSAPAFAQDENAVDMKDVPEAAMKMAMENAMGVTFDKAQVDDDEGTKTYELSGKMASGMMLEVDVLADGTLEEVEEQIAMDAVPAEVTATLNKEMQGFVPSMIEKSSRKDGLVVYEFEGKSADKEVDVEINADGTNYKMNDDLAG